MGPERLRAVLKLVSKAARGQGRPAAAGATKAPKKLEPRAPPRRHSTRRGVRSAACAFQNALCSEGERAPSLFASCAANVCAACGRGRGHQHEKGAVAPPAWRAQQLRRIAVH